MGLYETKLSLLEIKLGLIKTKLGLIFKPKTDKNWSSKTTRENTETNFSLLKLVLGPLDKIFKNDQDASKAPPQISKIFQVKMGWDLT